MHSCVCVRERERERCWWTRWQWWWVERIYMMLLAMSCCCNKHTGCQLRWRDHKREWVIRRAEYTIRIGLIKSLVHWYGVEWRQAKAGACCALLRCQKLPGCVAWRARLATWWRGWDPHHLFNALLSTKIHADFDAIHRKTRTLNDGKRWILLLSPKRQPKLKSWVSQKSRQWSVPFH